LLEILYLNINKLSILIIKVSRIAYRVKKLEFSGKVGARCIVPTDDGEKEERLTLSLHQDNENM